MRIIQLLFVAVAAVTLSTSSVRAGESQHESGAHSMKKAESVTLEGEVLDLYCFMKHPANGQGADHAKCAKNCIKKGLPIGFLVGDDVYVVVGKEHESAADVMADLAGQKARLKGKLMVHNGVRAIELESIEKL